MTDFCYLGDTLAQAGGCSDAVTARMRSAWKAFHDHLPIITNRGIALVYRGNVFTACVRRVLLYGSETWPLSQEDLRRMERCDHGMIRWICCVRLEQPVAMADLRARLRICSIDEALRWERLRLFDHRYRQDNSQWTKKIMDFHVEGPTPRGRPRLRWMDVVKKDLKEHNLSQNAASDRNKWRIAIRPRSAQPKELQPTTSGQRSQNVQ